MSSLFHPWQALRRAITRQFTLLLTKPLKNYTPRFPNDLGELTRHIKKGDILLVEGEQRVSEVIKYLTQSSWSHSALYIGDELIRRNHPQLGQLRAVFGDEVNHLLVEALVETGVVVSPLSKYINFNIRVCRPHLLRKEHIQLILDDIIGQLGHSYDMQNVFDLARYFLPVSLVPRRFRRKALHFGSGLPTQVICSSMLAAAFEKWGSPLFLSSLPNAWMKPRGVRGAIVSCCARPIHRHAWFFADGIIPLSLLVTLISPRILKSSSSTSSNRVALITVKSSGMNVTAQERAS